MKTQFDLKNIQEIYNLYFKLQAFCHTASPFEKKLVQKNMDEIQKWLLQNIKKINFFCQG